MGITLGWWKGDTLVVDRVALDEWVYLDQAHSHSDKLHIVGAVPQARPGHTEAEVTVDDPGVLAEPYMSTGVPDLALGVEISEFICQKRSGCGALWWGSRFSCWRFVRRR